MKNLSQYIQEKLIIKKNRVNYKYFPETKKELREIIEQRIEQEGNEVDLNDIDVLEITDMSELFMKLDFNGDISSWDVSKVNDMHSMFCWCKSFNQDLSSWDVSNVTDVSYMFGGCENFNQDISSWNVSNVKNMESMFYKCKKFNQDLSSWNVSNVTDMTSMFNGCKSFNQDISSWDISNVKFLSGMFMGCPIEDKYEPKYK